jgi:hypothetical protein
MPNEVEIYFKDLSSDLQSAVLDAVNHGGNVDVMFDDLESDKQGEVLEAAGVADSEDMNWDVVPLTILEYEPPESGDPPVRRAEDMNWDTMPVTVVEYEDELEEDVFNAEENPRREKMIARTPTEKRPFAKDMHKLIEDLITNLGQIVSDQRDYDKEYISLNTYLECMDANLIGAEEVLRWAGKLGYNVHGILKRTGVHKNPSHRHGLVPVEVFMESDEWGYERFSTSDDYDRETVGQFFRQIASLVDNAAKAYADDGLPRKVGIKIGSE